MKKSRVSAVNHKMFLEKKLSELNINDLDNNNIIRFFGTELFFEDYVLSVSDREYLIFAYLMPFEEIKNEIERYDESSPKLDEVLFVSELSLKYSVDTDAVVKRIRDVRSIIKARENNLYSGFKRKLTRKL